MSNRNVPSADISRHIWNRPREQTFIVFGTAHLLIIVKQVLNILRFFIYPHMSYGCQERERARAYKHTHTCLYIYIYIYIYIYTGCPRRNRQNFGRVFLMLKYTDITQNTYIQSWTVTEIMAREVWDFDSCYTLIDYQIHIRTGRNMWFL